MMKDVAACILTAGKGTRMNSRIPKVLHEVHSRPMVSFLIHALKEAGVGRIALVINPDNGAIMDAVKDVDFVTQEKPLGSGDAVNSARKYFSKFEGDVLVLCGDTPLVGKPSIENLVKEHRKNGASCTVLTARVTDPTGYGRIVRDAGGSISGIIEEQDASLFEEVIEEINVGAYCFGKEDLFSALDEVRMNTAKKEYYLTDAIGILKKRNKKISSVSTERPGEYIGINSRVELAEVNRIVRRNVLERFMAGGVTIIDPAATYIDMSANIGRDTTIHPGTCIEKNVRVGERCSIGPYARLRPETDVKDDVRIGNFAELVRTTVGSRTRINHMCYLGDAAVGEDVNIGAGAITANYDGKNKNRTAIGDKAFIGVGAILIAPVKIGKGAVVGAGSVVTKNKDVAAGQTVAGVPARILKTRSAT